jgi:class 3 adenylate cyclase/tetratricopeptide (TPR) repeat protein
MICASCGQENPDGFRFCGNCGAPLVEAPPLREVRKTVTVVFCDLTGSTTLGDTTDPEALRATMRSYYEEMRTILERHGGTVEKFIGDAVMAVFGVPVSHEDDALRAVRAAWEMRAAVPALGLRARIGVNTGEVVTGEGDTLVTGDAVNVAARLEQAAEPGEVLIGGETRRLVRDAVQIAPVEVSAKGKPNPVDAFRLLDVDPEAAPVARHMDTPLIGRTTELEQLRRAFERAVRERRCHLFTLLGAAGVGKSRLVAEFLRDVDADVVEGRCLDYGEGITYWPVVSILKQLGTRADETLARVVGGATMANEIFWAVRAFLESVASERPLVVVFDDIHWGEETFFDLIDHVADLSRGAPLLLLCIARPELLDKRAGWGGGKLNATTILLEPLDADECAELIAAHGGVEADVQGRILAAADGNPLFVEEMVALVREVGDVSVPSTVQALLQARIDQLAGAERVVIERGAVEGEVFHRGAVAELTRTSDVDPQLVGLVRKELIHPAPATLAGDQAFRFRHLLIRDAAYGALPKETRAELHERFADWLNANAHELIELDEIVGYHLEQAARYRRELGRPGAELAARAGDRLARAGRRAAERNDVPGAINLLSRAHALYAAEDRRALDALLDCLSLLVDAVRTEEAVDLIAELAASDDPGRGMHARVAEAHLLVLRESETTAAVIDQVADEALELFTSLEDERGLAAAWRLRAGARWLESRARETIEAHEHAAVHHARAGINWTHDPVVKFGPLVHGPFTNEEVLAHAAAIPADSPFGHILWSIVAWKEGRFDESLEITEQAVARLAELGIPTLLAAPSVHRATVLREQGRLAESLALWEEVAERQRQWGLKNYLSTSLVEIGTTLLLLGRLDEAERYALEGEEMGSVDDVVNFADGRGVRSLVAAARGEHEAAEELARSALDYAYRTDFPRIHAHGHQVLGFAHRSAGRLDEARSEWERSLEIWERYGWLSRARLVRDLLVQL